MKETAYTIAVLDDNADNALLLTTILEDEGFQTVVYREAYGALSAMQTAPPDLIMMDVNMPYMDGFEACQRMKSLEGLQDIPVIFISAMGEPENVIDGFDVGAVDYITKPFVAEIVIARIFTHLAKYQLQLELKASYEQVLRLEEVRDKMVHMVIHDIRTPLAGLLFNSELILHNISIGKEVTAEDIRKNIEAINRISGMLNDLLEVNKTQTAQMNLRLEQIDVCALCRHAGNDFRPQLEGFHFDFDLPNTPVLLTCDRDLLRRVLDNFLTNASKYTEKGGEICLSLNIGPLGALKITVGDTGRGIPAEDQAKIFDPYYKVKKAGNGSKISFGLGLAFCKTAVEAMGGEIGVESMEGVGSSFWVAFPDARIPGTRSNLLDSRLIDRSLKQPAGLRVS